MTLFVVVGMPASGKNCARGYAASKGYPYFATGDIVRMEVKNRGLESNAENTGIVSTEMRGADGLGVTRKALETALHQNSDVVFLEGIRSWQEIELIRKQVNAHVIAFLAPRKLRLSRILGRGRSDDSADAFESRDMREIEYGTAIPIALADSYILNTGTIDDALSRMEEILNDGLC